MPISTEQHHSGKLKMLVKCIYISAVVSNQFVPKISK
jgi:hypothetical protein